ncbi:MAG: hypothetical protein GEU98_03540 [Pseudonocardiaceae bacterium]|nr:hypothetical protein [Pseudonocardiaceae bacterium]
MALRHLATECRDRHTCPGVWADDDRHECAELADLREDFWLIDDEVAVRMIYDDYGHFLRPELVDDVVPYRRMRDVAMRCAEPLDEYLTRKHVRFTI